MKWMVAVAIVLAGCGSKGAKGGAGSGSAGSSTTPETGSAVGGGSAATIAEGPAPQITKVLGEAFKGALPAFPLVGASGVAAVAIETPLRLSEGSLYTVAFLPPGAGGPWDQVETIPLVDAMLAKLLTEGSPDGTSEPIFDKDTLTSRATAITTRLRADKFSAFEGTVAPLTLDVPASVGPAKLELTSSEAGLRIQIVDPGGAIFGTDNIAAEHTAMVAGEECVAKPVAERAWFDTARKRVLVKLGWSTPEQCEAPEAQYRLFALR